MISRQSKSYLIFTLYDSHYAIEATLVREIFLLPELIPISEAPDDVVGVLNFRSKIVPFIHLAKRLGYPLQKFSLNDNALALEWEGLQIGMIVNTVREVMTIEPTAIEADISYGSITERNARFISDVALVDADIIMLLNPERLIRNFEAMESFIAEENSSNEVLKTEGTRSFYDLYCPNATPAEREIFRQRSETLRQSISISEDTTEQISLAVIGLNGKYFGLDINLVREFIDIHHITPIPCCPNYILGNMNLRGEILTLIDIRQALNMSCITPDKVTQAMVVQVGDIVAGIPIEQVWDVMYVRALDVQPLPLAVQLGSEFYLQGTIPYAETMLSILDLPKILNKGGLAVNEEVYVDSYD